MKVAELAPEPKHRVSFRLASYRSVPKEAGCYVLATYEDDVLYVGLSDSLFSRFQQHLGNSEKTSPTSEGKAIWFYFSLHDFQNLPELERTWMNHFVARHGRRPILNKVDSPVA